ncbi:MAG: hypothetical protein K9L75_01735 [Spirochaetia bacterium]|nr:hypothetical protein [Spirochaetia bacterium]
MKRSLERSELQTRPRKRTYTYILGVLAIVLTAALYLVTAASCSTGGGAVGSTLATDAAQQGEATAETSVSRDWEIALTGEVADSVSGASLYTDDGEIVHGEELVLMDKGTERTYRGIPLYRLLARVDGPAEQHPYSFDEELWKEGYEVTVTASDGAAVAFLSSDYPYDDLLLALERDGAAVPPTLLGEEFPPDLRVEDAAAIEIILGDTEAGAAEPRLTVETGGAAVALTQSELKQAPSYVKGVGGYTTSAGTYYEHRYGGAALYELLSSFGEPEEGGTLKVTSSDGYEMSYSMEDIADSDEGLWIIAFEQDGAFMSADPGPFRIIKIRPDFRGSASQDASQAGAKDASQLDSQAEEMPIPNIDGHNSARMVSSLSFSRKPMKDFTLNIEGKRSVEVGRTTLQAGINCSAHKTTVNYYNRKSGETEHYTGIPLYAVLAIGDDPDYEPHKQTDKAILAYDQEAAERGYSVTVIAADGFSITLDSRELHMNNQVILAMYQDGEELQGDDWPLKIVWDQDADPVPEGIKAVRQVETIQLQFDETD